MIDYITGGGGFIGSRLKAELIRCGQVHAIPHKLIGVYRLEPYDRFFFLSTYGNMAQHKDIDQIFQANILDFCHVLHETRERGFNPSLFLFVSSSSVTLPTQTAYSSTKKAAEQILEASPIPTCIVRPYSVIGVGEQKEHLIPTLIRSCMEGEEMPFVPDATHDFIDVEDVVKEIVMLADKGMTGVHELGTGEAVSNQTVKEIVEDVCGKKANIRIVETLRMYDNKDWCCKHPAFGWMPKKTLRQSVQEMVDEYVRAKSS